jgi:hypothetical protein
MDRAGYKIVFLRYSLITKLHCKQFIRKITRQFRHFFKLQIPIHNLNVIEVVLVPVSCSYILNNSKLNIIFEKRIV